MTTYISMSFQHAIMSTEVLYVKVQASFGRFRKKPAIKNSKNAVQQKTAKKLNFSPRKLNSTQVIVKGLC